MDKDYWSKWLTEQLKNQAEAFKSDMSGLRRTKGDTHDWFIEEVDGGAVGVSEFFACRSCGASGSPIYASDVRTPVPFLADGTGLKLPLNCDEAKTVIAEHKKQMEKASNMETRDDDKPPVFTVGDLKKVLEGLDDSLPVCVEADAVVDGEVDQLHAVVTGARFAKGVRQDLPLSLGPPFDHLSISADGVPEGTCRDCGYEGGKHGTYCSEARRAKDDVDDDSVEDDDGDDDE